MEKQKEKMKFQKYIDGCKKTKKTKTGYMFMQELEVKPCNINIDRATIEGKKIFIGTQYKLEVSNKTVDEIIEITSKLHI